MNQIRLNVIETMRAKHPLISQMVEKTDFRRGVVATNGNQTVHIVSKTLFHHEQIQAKTVWPKIHDAISAELNTANLTIDFILEEESTRKGIMGKFEIGQRVSVYTCSGRFTGVVARSQLADCISVQADMDGVIDIWHEKQCRKLVKRKRREFWVVPGPNAYLVFTNLKGATDFALSTNVRPEIIHTVEVRKKAAE